MATQPDPGTPRVTIQLPDPLKHFSRDGPWFRLAALVLPKLIHAVVTVCIAFVTWTWVSGTRLSPATPGQVAVIGSADSIKPVTPSSPKP